MAAIHEGRMPSTRPTQMPGQLSPSTGLQQAGLVLETTDDEDEEEDEAEAGSP